MCGICGIWYFNPNHHLEPGVLERMTAALAHRGPDDAGFFCDKSIGLGFRRLSLIDRASGQQPLANEDQQLWLVCNGEIYNYQALRQMLKSHSFRTKGDVEAILHLYEERGLGCLEKLRGMFALALWDSHRRELALAVDRFGEKPLYYALDADKIIFGSELKAVIAASGMVPALDLDALDDYFASGYIGAPRTIYREICKLSPGQVITIHQDGTAQSHTYWQPQFAEPSLWDRRPAAELAAELCGLLQEAVRLRLVSDEPIGVFLSGGIDSSSVTALMSQHYSAPVKAFSIGFDEPAFDERNAARAAAEASGVELVHEVITSRSLEVLPNLIRQFDEPFADSSMIPTYFVSRLARQHVKAVLSGDGGDEVFGGYLHYLYAYRQSILQRCIPGDLQSFAARSARWLPAFSKIKPYLAAVDQSPSYWRLKTEFFNINQRRLLYGGRPVPRTAEHRMVQLFRQNARLDGVSQLQQYDLLTYLPNDILVKVDRASMFASLEVRAPLLDHQLFEFAARIPPYHRMTVFRGKRLLKIALGKQLPAVIKRRPKQGFSIPQADWLKHSALARAVLLDGVDSPVLDRVYIRGLWEEHISGQADHKDRLWAVLCFLLWSQTTV